MLYLSTFRPEFEKTIVIFGISIYEFFQNRDSCVEAKNFKFGADIALYSEWNLRKTNIIFEISIVEFVEMQNFKQSKKTLSLGQKMLYLGNFRPQFEKTIVIFQMTILIKFMLKKKKIIFRDKTVFGK